MANINNKPGMLKPNEAILQFLTDTFVPITKHLFQILPEAVFVFLFLFSILTQNFANGVLVFTLIESILLFSVIGKGVDYFTTTTSPIKIPSGACESGFPSSTSSYATLAFSKGYLTQNNFPSGSIAMLATLIGYLLTSLFQYKKELKQLGPDWESRVPIAVVLSFLTLTAFVLFRFIAGCESLGKITGTLIIGILMGTALVFQNIAVFGKESVNILGIPTLESKSLSGKPIYVCSASS